MNIHLKTSSNPIVRPHGNTPIGEIRWSAKYQDPDYVHLNNYLGSLADLWPEMKREFDSRSATASTPRQSLYSGLESTGISQSMMGVADAGYANTAGAALKDIGLFGMCFMEEKWSSDGDRTFVLKVTVH